MLRGRPFDEGGTVRQAAGSSIGTSTHPVRSVSVDPDPARAWCGSQDPQQQFSQAAT